MAYEIMDRAKTREISLDFPVQLADRLLDKVVMRRPTVGDMHRHNISAISGMNEAIPLMADLCGLTPDDIQQLDVCDFEKLEDQLLRFRGLMEKPKNL